MSQAATLDHNGIAALIPHAGTMCLLARVDAWDAARIRCVATSHTDSGNPLRSASGLLASAAIEYAAQAAAVHGALNARAAGIQSAPGFLASARGVHLHRMRLDDLAGELAIETEQLAGAERQLLYAFSVRHAGQAIVEGRLAVVLVPARPERWRRSASPERTGPECACAEHPGPERSNQERSGQGGTGAAARNVGCPQRRDLHAAGRGYFVVHRGRRLELPAAAARSGG